MPRSAAIAVRRVLVRARSLRSIRVDQLAQTGSSIKRLYFFIFL